ncbi:MAG: signal peptidase I [Acidimicrobiales bacterium]
MGSSGRPNPNWDDLEAQFHADIDTPDHVEARERRIRRMRTRRRVQIVLEWVLAVGAAVAVGLLVQAHVAQIYLIPSASMEPTLVEGDRVVVSKASYWNRSVRRGDVVVFGTPDAAQIEVSDLVKRVIAVEGETVWAEDGQIFIDGTFLIEPYLPGSTVTEDFGPVVVPEGHLFVMGDNRGPAMSLDSRFFGSIPEETVVGRVALRIWPVGRLGTL